MISLTNSLLFTPSLINFKTLRSCTASLRPRFRALKTGSDGDKVIRQDTISPDLLKKPTISPLDEEGPAKKDVNEETESEDWVDWEDQILEDTVPLVGFVRMLLHSGK